MTTTPLTLQNGIYVETTEFSQTSHLDSAHVYAMNKGSQHSTHLGLIEPFITSGFMKNPYIYNFANVQATRIEVPGGIYDWEYPIADEPLWILEDLSLHDKPGIAGEKFKIKVSERKYDNGYILTPDPHSPEQLLVTEDEIINEVDGVILTVKYHGPNAGERWFPKALLARNTKLFAVGTVETEYSKTYSSIPTFGGGVRKYMNTVGHTRSQMHYEVTRDAAYMQTSEKCVAPLDMAREVIQMYRFQPGSLGAGLSGQSPKQVLRNAYSKQYGKNAEKRMKRDIVQKLWIPKIEALGMATLETMREMKAIWGAGGVVDYDGKTRQVGSVGLFHQLNMGNQYVFNLFNFTFQKLENIIAERLRGKVTAFNNNNVTTVKVGTGMYALLRDQITRYSSDMGMVFQAQDVLTNLGTDNRNVGLNPVQVNTWNMLNGYGRIKLEIVPGLNQHDANSAINPMVTVNTTTGSHRLSSYMMIIDDITNSEGGNICELVYKDDWDIQARVKIGKLNYMGAPTFNSSGLGNMFVSSSDHAGYEVMMTARDKAYWVKDITKSLLIKPINPVTGRAIYDPIHRG